MSKWPENVEKGARRLLSEMFCEDEAEVLADYKKHFPEILAQNIEETIKSEGEDFWKKTDESVSEDDAVAVNAPDDTGRESENEKNTVDMIAKARENRKKRQTQWRVALSIAAVFVFLIGGTILTRGKLRDTDRPVIPSVPVTDHPGGNTGDGGTDIIDTSEIKTPEGVSAFFEDMWLFVKAAAPELICAAAGVAAGIFIMKRKEQRSNSPDDGRKIQG